MWIVIGIAIVVLLILLFHFRCNTYVLIARNLTYIYEILRNEYKERFPDEDTLLMACGMIDTRSYTFSLEDMKGVILRAKSGECFTSNLYHGTRDTLLLQISYQLAYSHNLFLNFVMQLEIIIFLNDTSFNRKDILTAVVSSAKKIEKKIERVKRSYASGKRPLFLYRAVSNFMTSDTFERVRNRIGIIHPAPEQQIDKIFQELVKHKHWKDVNPDIIKRIFNNAKGDVDAIKRFIFISELYNSVGNNFVKLPNGALRKDIPFVIARLL